MGDMWNSYKILVENIEGRPWHSCENNIMMYLKETSCGGMDQIQKVQDRISGRFLWTQ